MNVQEHQVYLLRGHYLERFGFQSDLVKAMSGKTGEKVEIRRFARFELGGN